MSYLNISRIIDVQSTISASTQTRRDFSLPCFVYSGDVASGLYQTYQDVVDDFGSNTEAAKAAEVFFTGGFNGIKPTQMYIYSVPTSSTLATETTTLLSDPRYYMIAVDNSFSEADNKALAAAIEASTAISYYGVFLTTDGAVASTTLTNDTTSIAKYFYTADYEKNALFYDDTANADEYKQVAAMSYFATVDYTVARPLGGLAFKEMTGQTPSTLTNTWATNLEDKHCNYYASFGELGRNIFYKGVSASNRFMDVIIGADWLDYNMTYNIYDLLITLPKLSYTNADFNKLYVAMAEILEQSKDFGLIAAGTDTLTGIYYPAGYEISIPKPADVTSSDKTSGILKDIIVTAILSGNIVKITVTNLLKY
jgi:hypothetical protein